MADLRLDKVAFLEAVLEARYTGELELMLSGFTRCARLRFVGNPACAPFAGDWQGHDGIRAGLERLALAFDCNDFAIDDCLIDGERAAVRYTLLLRDRRCGSELELEVMAHVVFREGLVASLTEFADTRLLMPVPQLVETLGQPARRSAA